MATDLDFSFNEPGDWEKFRQIAPRVPPPRNKRTWKVFTVAALGAAVGVSLWAVATVQPALMAATVAELRSYIGAAPEASNATVPVNTAVVANAPRHVRSRGVLAPQHRAGDLAPFDVYVVDEHNHVSQISPNGRVALVDPMTGELKWVGNSK
jgi:hypothetical protein